MKYVYLLALVLNSSIIFSQTPISSKPLPTAKADTIVHPVDLDWEALRKDMIAKNPSISADSNISVIKIAHYKNQWMKVEPILLDFLKKYGDNIPLGHVNSYAWSVFLRSSNNELINVATNIFKTRLPNEENTESTANRYDTYAGLLYKAGRKTEALVNQIKAYSILTGEELMLDMNTGSVLTGTKKADFLITAFKMEKGISTWLPYVPDSTNVPLKTEYRYWNKLKNRLLSFYTIQKADSLIAFTQVRYYRQNKQWANYAESLVKYANKYQTLRTLEVKNTHAWEVFIHSQNPKALRIASNWLVGVVDTLRTPEASYYIDTYANLLYKAGNVKKAIFWEEKAVDKAPETEKAALIATLKKMKNGEQTW